MTDRSNVTHLLHIQGHFNAVTSLSIAPDGWTMLSAGRDNVAILWDLRANTKSATVPVFEAIEGQMRHLSISIGNSVVESFLAHQTQQFV